MQSFTCQVRRLQNPTMFSCSLIRAVLAFFDVLLISSMGSSIPLGMLLLLSGWETASGEKAAESSKSERSITSSRSPPRTSRLWPQPADCAELSI